MAYYNLQETEKRIRQVREILRAKGLDAALIYFDNYSMVKYDEAPHANTTAYIFLTLCGVNFLTELGLSILLAPVITRLIQIGKKQ